MPHSRHVPFPLLFLFRVIVVTGRDSQLKRGIRYCHCWMAAVCLLFHVHERSPGVLDDPAVGSASPARLPVSLSAAAAALFIIPIT